MIADQYSKFNWHVLIKALLKLLSAWSEYLSLLSPICRLIGVTSVQRALMWSSTLLFTSQRTAPPISHVRFAIRSFHALPASNLT